MNPEAEYDRIVGALYNAALQPESWKQAFADLTVWSGADVFHFLRWDAASQHMSFDVHSDGVDHAIEQYGAYYGAIDPRRILTSQGLPGRVSACQRHFDDRYVARSEFYQDYLLPEGMRHTLGSVVLDEDGSQMLLGLVRERRRGAFDDAQIERLERAMPHVMRACRLWMQTEQLRDAASLGQQIARNAGLAVFGLDATGRVVHANSQAERLLQAADSLVAPGGRLGTVNADETAALQGAIAAVLRGEAPKSVAAGASRAGAPTCFLTVAALPLGAPLTRQLGHACVLVTARQREQRSTVSAEQLTQLFGLTPAECSVTLALVDGKTPAEYAREAGLSMPTVRTQLRAVFEKTKTRRQADTVRLLQRLP